MADVVHLVLSIIVDSEVAAAKVLDAMTSITMKHTMGPGYGVNLSVQRYSDEKGNTHVDEEVSA